MKRSGLGWVVVAALALVGGAGARAEQPPGEAPALGSARLSQEDVRLGRIGLRDLRLAGLRLFGTPFNRLDGYGDGPGPGADPLHPGERPTLQGNGTFLRLNGLDGQSCLECHSIVSAATVPLRLGIGGVGGSVSNALIKPTRVDPADLEDGDGRAAFDGRFANPPFLFGSGGVELLALEMTTELQARAREARRNPGVEVALVTKGISFGVLVADAQGNLDTRGVVGVDEDLVVRPFGRKGEFATVREFDLEALPFHFGMQPTEVVGVDVDADGDGVVNEVTSGEVSALHAFAVTLEACVEEGHPDRPHPGESIFREIGCAECHVPALRTVGRHLPLRFPEVATDPQAHVFLWIDLRREGPRFAPAPGGGLEIRLFSDLKRHDMGPGLAEDFALADEQRNREYVTARLWGIADTAPYLHDGRATTLTDAILAHGGEGAAARDAFAARGAAKREALLGFLRTLRTPASPAASLLEERRDPPAPVRPPRRPR